MDVLRLTSEDFKLVVRADGVHHAFHQTYLRSFDLLRATSYNFDGDTPARLEILSVNEQLLSNDLFELSLGVPAHPVFFENKEYLFDLEFLNSDVEAPTIKTRLLEVERSFISRKIHGHFFLTAAINFFNDIGKSEICFEYKKNKRRFKCRLNFEVFPTKLDYCNDYKNIISDINNEFSSLVFDALKKTYSHYESGNEVNNDLIWWSVFGRLYTRILAASNLIIKRPHNKLVRKTSLVKVDRLKFLTAQLENEVSQHRTNLNRYYATNEQFLTVDTPENRFFKYVIVSLNRRFSQIKDSFFKCVGLRVSQLHKDEVLGVEAELQKLVKHPFFKNIGSFKNFKQESLVIRNSSGYSSLYKAWIILKKGLDFLDGINQIELKNIASLYQIWCFLEVKNLIQDILGVDPAEVDIAEILIEGFTIRLKSGRYSRVSFLSENGDEVELFHQLRYTDLTVDKSRSLTVNQEPDIVLKMSRRDLGEKLKFTYLFDAKYRLASKEGSVSADSPPDEAINQMHRYRDAIYYDDESDQSKPKKEVIGAYVLYPGSDSPDIVRKQNFFRSIQTANIGAFPLIPAQESSKNHNLLKEFLTNILLKKTSFSILRDDVPPFKALEYEDADGIVLAGFIDKKVQRDYFSSSNPRRFHMPATQKLKHLDKIKYFAPIIGGIEKYYLVEEIQVIPRNEIFSRESDLYSSKISPYYVFQLGKCMSLLKRIRSTRGGNRVFRYARLSQLCRVDSIDEFNLSDIH